MLPWGPSGGPGLDAGHAQTRAWLRLSVTGWPFALSFLPGGVWRGAPLLVRVPC